MNGSSYSNNNLVVRLRGLPWNTSQSEVQNFLQGCKTRQINLATNEQGRTAGECFVILESKDDFDLAKSFHQKCLGSRYIEVFESNSDEMNQIIKNNSNSNTPRSDNSSSNLTIDNWHEPVVRLRGLPYNSSKDDVMGFFKGLDIAQNGVHISSSKPAGEAFVAFMNMDNALRALEFNRMNMGHRYIEVFKSTYAEARASIMNDTQSMGRQRGHSSNTGSGSGSGSGGQNQNYGSQRHGNYSSQGGNTGGHNSGYNYNNHGNNMNQYNGPPSNNYNSYGGNNNSGNNYSANNQMGSGNSGGVKRPMSISFTMKIRGVPFEAGEKDVFEFFSPVVPIRLEQEPTPRGKPPIWYAEFGSREEATEALTFHKKYMGTRYIELLPLYDDGNRSKMVRT